MSFEHHTVRELVRAFDIKRNATKTVFHNTKLLLQLYRKVNWRLEMRLNDLEEECIEECNTDIKGALNELAGLIDGYDTAKLEASLISMLHSRSIILLIDKSIAMLRDYPDNGELYFRILNMAFVTRYPIGENAIITELDVSRTTFYKLKKEAIATLGVILWGFLVPTFQDDTKAKSTTRIMNIART